MKKEYLFWSKKIVREECCIEATIEMKIFRG
jgi:hypothetical protein